MEFFVCVRRRAVSKRRFSKDLPTPAQQKPPVFQAEGFLLYQRAALWSKAAADCRGYRTIRLIVHIQRLRLPALR